MQTLTINTPEAERASRALALPIDAVAPIIHLVESGLSPGDYGEIVIRFGAGKVLQVLRTNSITIR